MSIFILLNLALGCLAIAKENREVNLRSFMDCLTWQPSSNASFSSWNWSSVNFCSFWLSKIEVAIHWWGFALNTSSVCFLKSARSVLAQFLRKFNVREVFISFIALHNKSSSLFKELFVDLTANWHSSLFLCEFWSVLLLSGFANPSSLYEKGQKWERRIFWCQNFVFANKSGKIVSWKIKEYSFAL